MSSEAGEKLSGGCVGAATGRGMLVVVSSPSGGGKGTLVGKVLTTVPELKYSVSFTTRAPRESEVEGRDYFFVSVAEFRAMQAAGSLLESATVHGNLYGTGRDQVVDELSQGKDIVLEIDVQGAESVRALVPDAVSVFILPPSFEALQARLMGRGSEQPGERELRLKNARRELERYREFDYVIVNDVVERAAAQLAAIVYAERAKRVRQEEVVARVVATFP